MYVQQISYDIRMAPSKPIQIRLTPVQWRILRKLSDRLGLDHSNVVRLAITRLAEQEHILHFKDPTDDGRPAK